MLRFLQKLNWMKTECPFRTMPIFKLLFLRDGFPHRLECYLTAERKPGSQWPQGISSSAVTLYTILQHSTLYCKTLHSTLYNTLHCTATLQLIENSTCSWNRPHSTVLQHSTLYCNTPYYAATIFTVTKTLFILLQHSTLHSTLYTLLQH